jgi:hypothetical protein
MVENVMQALLPIGYETGQRGLGPAEPQPFFDHQSSIPSRLFVSSQEEAKERLALTS